MAEITRHTPGTFCWVDALTPDAAASKDFYCRLMGWTTIDNPVGDGIVYTMLQKDGKNVGGLVQMNAEELEQGIPPHWNSYVAVEDVEDAAAKVAAAGGTVTMPPMDVLDVGRTAWVHDSAGAAFALWQPMSHIGADIINEPGALGWNELNTNDVAAAGAFYEQAFGWSRQEQDMGGGHTYHEFMLGEQPVAGMMAIQPEWGEVPPHWSIYLCVENCDESLAKAESLGAGVVVPATSVSDIRFALLRDPQGIHVGIVHAANPGS